MELSGKIVLTRKQKPGPETGSGTFMLVANPENEDDYCYVGTFPLSKASGNTVTLSVGVGLSSFLFSGKPGDSVLWLKVGGSGFGHNPAA